MELCAVSEIESVLTRVILVGPMDYRGRDEYWIISRRQRKLKLNLLADLKDRPSSAVRLGYGEAQRRTVHAYICGFAGDYRASGRFDCHLNTRDIA